MRSQRQVFDPSEIAETVAAVLAAGMAARILWPRYRHLWQAYRIRRRVAAYTDDHPRRAVAFYLSAIEELLVLAGSRGAPGSTIETYLDHLESVAKTRSDPVLVADFNQMYYNDEAGEQQTARRYKALFQSVYADIRAPLSRVLLDK